MKYSSRTRSIRSRLLPGYAPALGLLVVFAGCAGPRTTIAELDPYVGSRPSPITPLPRPKQTSPVTPRHLSTGPRQGWMPPRGIVQKWECVVVHHSDSDKSTPSGMRDWHVRGRGWDELGYHFVIGNGIGYGDGEVYVGKRWEKQMHGAHCKTPGNFYNDHGIGICLIGDLDSHPPTRKQIAALADLTSFLCDQCSISKSKVKTHGGITGKTRCPGRYFSLSSLLQRMRTQTAAVPEDADSAELGQ